MGNIHDALKRAQEARERLRQSEPGGGIGPAGNSAGAPPVSVGGPAPASSEPGAAATPVAAALKLGTVSTADTTAIRVTESVIENYERTSSLPLNPRLVVYHDKAGAIAEQYRRIRNNMFAVGQEGARFEPQMLVVTSASAGEGKTVTTANLGLSLAEIRGIRTLLIDGDLQHGMLSRFMMFPQARGLSELLSSGEKPETYVQATAFHNLFVLPSGATGPAKVTKELLRLPSLRGILRQLKHLYDVILIDSPPAMKFPDAGIMAASGDGVLLAVGLNRTRQSHVQRTVRLFHAMNIPLRGCILADRRS